MNKINLSSKKNFLNILLTLLILTIILFYFNKNNYLHNFTKINICYGTIILLSCWVLMMLTTTITFGVRLSDKSYKLFDLATYPLIQTLWGYLIPIQGSLIFSSIYFKKEHSISVTDSISINILFVLLSLILGGIFGLVYSIINNLNFYIITFFLLSFIIGISFFIFNELGFKLNLPSKLFYKINLFVNNLAEDLNKSLYYLLGNKKLLFFYFLRVFLISSWYWFISISLEINASYPSILILFFFLEASVILKVAPGNWGVNQLVGGLIFSSIELSAADAVAISSIALLSTLILSSTIGLVANFFFMKRIGISNFKSLINIIKSES